jgi:hypothetical protein
LLRIFVGGRAQLPCVTHQLPAHFVSLSFCARPCALQVKLTLKPALVVVVVVNILLQIKRTTLMIGHCTALAVIVTKTLAGKLSELKQDKEAKLTTPHVLV